MTAAIEALLLVRLEPFDGGQHLVLGPLATALIEEALWRQLARLRTLRDRLDPVLEAAGPELAAARKLATGWLEHLRTMREERGRRLEWTDSTHRMLACARAHLAALRHEAAGRTQHRTAVGYDQPRGIRLAQLDMALQALEVDAQPTPLTTTLFAQVSLESPGLELLDVAFGQLARGSWQEVDLLMKDWRKRGLDPVEVASRLTWYCQLESNAYGRRILKPTIEGLAITPSAWGITTACARAIDSLAQRAPQGPELPRVTAAEIERLVGAELQLPVIAVLQHAFISRVGGSYAVDAPFHWDPPPTFAMFAGVQTWWEVLGRVQSLAARPVPEEALAIARSVVATWEGSGSWPAEQAIRDLHAHALPSFHRTRGRAGAMFRDWTNDRIRLTLDGVLTAAHAPAAYLEAIASVVGTLARNGEVGQTFDTDEITAATGLERTLVARLGPLLGEQRLGLSLRGEAAPAGWRLHVEPRLFEYAEVHTPRDLAAAWRAVLATGAGARGGGDSWLSIEGARFDARDLGERLELLAADLVEDYRQGSRIEASERKTKEGRMLVLAAEKTGAQDFERIELALDEDEERSILSTVAELLRTRGEAAAAELLQKLPFRLSRASNTFGDSFLILHADLPISEYEQLRGQAREQATRRACEVLRAAFNDDVDLHVRFVACELATAPTLHGPRSVPSEALAGPVREMALLMNDVATGVRRLDQAVEDEYAQLRKALARHAALVALPPIVTEGVSAAEFLRLVRTDRASYAERRMFITENFSKYYDARLLPGAGQKGLRETLAERELDVQRELGKGGFGVVYLATHRTLGVTRAVKVFDPMFFDPLDPKALQRFSREARILGTISDPNIVRFYDAGIAGGTPYIVTEFVEGSSLREALKEHGPYPWQDAGTICSEVLKGLVAAHAAGIVHRDIKPTNVMWNDGRLKILDFGASALFNEEASKRLTTTAIGTLGYLAPELLNDPMLLDPRTDLFSVGVLAHELVTGRLPNPADPAALLTATDGRFAGVVLRALKPLASRYIDAVQMLAALLALTDPKPTKAPAPTLQPTGPMTREEVAVLMRIRPEDLPEDHAAWAIAELSTTVNPREPQELAVHATSVFATVGECRRRENQRVVPIDQVEFEAILVSALGFAVPDDAVPFVALASLAQQATQQAVALGLLTTEEYDAWRPGMASGSGMRDQLTLSPLGRKMLQRRGWSTPARSG